ncbi:MAG TPA: DmsE family decaheme c-type cytochrome [Candidatus Limnocylindrales bacterium]|nr:DmsE family decaheme c-type cytochrome [Candidatus Limnocylindrales bacterium]
MMLTQSRTIPTVFLALFLACLLNTAISAHGQAANPNPQTSFAPTAGPQYVGSDTCKTCHEDQYKQIEATQHWNTNLANLKKGTGQEWHGCESCHGPGSAHVDGGGDKSKIFSFKGATAQQVSARCQTCHGTTHPDFQRSVHYQADVSCITCHSPHQAKEQVALLKAKTPTLCYGCHTDAIADFNRPFHHRVNEGLIQCQDCHNVHGSLPKAARISTAQDQICLKCHTEKRGPFVFNHLPVKTEGCTACHVPHGSNNPRLLTRNNVNNLCIECHGLSTFLTLHNQSNKYQACTMCHVAIHGSNASDVFFK